MAPRIVRLEQDHETQASSLSLASLSLSFGPNLINPIGGKTFSSVQDASQIKPTFDDNNMGRARHGSCRWELHDNEVHWTPATSVSDLSSSHYDGFSSAHGRYLGGGERFVDTEIIDGLSNGSKFRMSAGAGAGAQGKRTVRSLFNEMLKRNSKITPLGYSTSSSIGGSNSEMKTEDMKEDAEGQISIKGDQKRVLILMSDTGGGHRASAEAIKAAFEQQYGDEYKVTVIDLWKEHTPWPFNQMPNSYSFLVKHETLWKVAFHVTKPRFVHQPQMAATSAFVAREVAKGLNKYEPDVIVSVHPLMQHVPLRVLRKKGLLHRIPFTTVITDLNTCHPTWFHKLVTLCFCPTEDVAKRALKAGLDQSQIRVHGLPIRPSFCLPTAPKDELRRQLGMDENLPAVILIGGGEGMGPVEKTARALAKSLGQNEERNEPIGQLVIICGRNARLLSKLQLIQWPMPTVVKGFVTNMPEWMAASDCIITKAGPGTIAESLIRGLPLIINDYIAGQEVGNVPFVVDNGVGKYSEDPTEISSIVAGWFGANSFELRTMSTNALKLARPEAVFNIVRDLDRLARHKPLLAISNHANLNPVA